MNHSLPTFAVKHVYRNWGIERKVKGRVCHLPFQWSVGKENHITGCYFCMINLKGINLKNKYHVQYSDVSSAMRPIHHGLGLPVPEPDGNMEYSSDSRHSDITVVIGDDAQNPEEDDQPLPLIQAELNDHETWKFPKSLLSFWVDVLKRNITRNNVLLVWKPCKRIKTVFPRPW